MGGKDSEGGFDKRRLRQDDSEVQHSQPRQGSQEPRVAPGKRPRTGWLARMPAPAQQTPNRAPASSPDPTPGAATNAAASYSADARSEQDHAAQAALTARWTDTALRPDLFPPPEWRPPVQRQVSGKRAA